MLRRYQNIIAIVMCTVLLMTTAGCRMFGKKKGLEGEDILAEEIPYVMSERFEDGVRITDVSFRTVQFRYNSFQIDPGETAKIEAVSRYMQSNPDTRLVAEGHCDERGSREYNMSLGESRAQAVRAYLIGLRIPGARIQTRSYGEERPLSSGHTESAWRLNRRVEFALYR